MRSTFRRSFVRDLEAIRDRSILSRVRQVIESVEAAGGLRDVPAVRGIRSETGFYRIRVGDYRIGLFVKGDEVEFVRCLHRRDIYRYFP